MDEGRYDTPDVAGQHRLILWGRYEGDRRYLGPDGVAVCGKCRRGGVDLSLLPECTSGPFGTGDKL